MTYRMWPQVLFAVLLIAVVILNFVKDGQPMKDPTHNGKQSFWAALWMALVLGMGGFWEIH